MGPQTNAIYAYLGLIMRLLDFKNGHLDHIFDQNDSF